MLTEKCFQILKAKRWASNQLEAVPSASMSCLQLLGDRLKSRDPHNVKAYMWLSCMYTYHSLSCLLLFGDHLRSWHTCDQDARVPTICLMSVLVSLSLQTFVTYCNLLYLTSGAKRQAKEKTCRLDVRETQHQIMKPQKRLRGRIDASMEWWQAGYAQSHRHTQKTALQLHDNQ